MKSNTLSETRLVEQDFIDVASDLNLSIAAIKAVDAVESGGSGFLPTGEVKILFEPHIFSRYTRQRFDRSHPTLSYPIWGKLPYGPTALQWSKLRQAMRLDETAALMSASYGRFQVCGFNYKICGYQSVQAFVEAMKQDETNHLTAFAEYVRMNALDDELRRRDWDGFAAGYNGPQYRKNDYAGKLRRAYLGFGGK